MPGADRRADPQDYNSSVLAACLDKIAAVVLAPRSEQFVDGLRPLDRGLGKKPGIFTGTRAEANMPPSESPPAGGKHGETRAGSTRLLRIL